MANERSGPTFKHPFGGVTGGGGGKITIEVTGLKELDRFFVFAPRETKKFMRSEWDGVNRKAKKELQTRLDTQAHLFNLVTGQRLLAWGRAWGQSIHSSSGTPRPHLRDSIKTISKFSGTDTIGGYAKVTFEGSFRGPKYAKNVFYLAYWYEWGSFKAGVRRTKEGWLRGKMPALHPVELTRQGKENDFAAATSRALDRLAAM